MHASSSRTRTVVNALSTAKIEDAARTVQALTESCGEAGQSDAHAGGNDVGDDSHPGRRRQHE